MQEIKVNETPVHIYDNEHLLIQAATDEIIKLPAGATLAMWPGPVGRQILSKLATSRKDMLSIYVLGHIEGVDVTTFFNLPAQLKMTSVPSSNIDLTILTPRPTTLDVGVSPKINQ